LLSAPQDTLVAYLRSDSKSDDNVAVVVNRDDNATLADYAMPEAWKDKSIIDALSGEAAKVENGRFQITMAPKSVRILSTLPGKMVR
jgi:hypothetical protein